MFLEEFNKYQSQYERGIKKISFRTSQPKIVKGTNELTLEKSNGNYNLYFNRFGRLLHSVHFELARKEKVIYGYNINGKIISAMRLDSEYNTMSSFAEYIYDDEGRIETEIERSFYVDEEDKTEYIHSYTENTEELYIDCDSEDLAGTFYTTFDNKKRIIENKSIRGEFELINWSKYEYDDKDNLIKEIFIDENGEPYGEIEYIHFKKDHIEGYQRISKDSTSTIEYSYTKNHKGHWINKVMLKNGEPQYIYDRTIEYY